jgi:hypothetical protein
VLFGVFPFGGGEDIKPSAFWRDPSELEESFAYLSFSRRSISSQEPGGMVLQVLQAFGIPQGKHLYFISVSGHF